MHIHYVGTSQITPGPAKIQERPVLKLLERSRFPLREGFASYENIEVLAQGSSGVTRKATDSEGRAVVIKELKDFLLPSMSESMCAQAITEFGKEAAILAGINHPRIPRCLDTFSREVEGEIRFDIVTEFIEGKSIADLIREGRLFSEAEAIDLLRQKLDILRYLQDFRTPILHRDIKPGNLILAPDDRINLIDFGIAKASEGSTKKGTECGTTGYAAPEQILTGKTSTASDVYGVGATTIAMITGKDPAEMLNGDGAIDFSRYARLSEPFSTFLRKMTAFDENRRFQNADEAMKALNVMGSASTLELSLTASEPLALEAAGATKKYAKALEQRASDLLKILRAASDLAILSGKSGDEYIRLQLGEFSVAIFNDRMIIDIKKNSQFRPVWVPIRSTYYHKTNDIRVPSAILLSIGSAIISLGGPVYISHAGGRGFEALIIGGVLDSFSLFLSIKCRDKILQKKAGREAMKNLKEFLHENKEFWPHINEIPAAMQRRLKEEAEKTAADAHALENLPSAPEVKKE